MALTSLLDLELAVPDPDGLEAFWNRRGLVTTGPGTLGTKDRASQLRLRESAYRHVSEMRLACEAVSDLDEIAGRLDGLGLTSVRDDRSLRCDDPILDHQVIIEVAEVEPLIPPIPRVVNPPGARLRIDRRSSAATGDDHPAPRRVGHVVFGSTDVAATLRFYRDGLGMKVSDGVGSGVGYFLRCSTDHHNLLVMPAPVPCLNHYAVEMDDVDAIGRTGMEVVRERPESSVYGLGRHVLGSNLFWYLLDPAGGMFELFADMDQIVDDDRWEAEERRDDWDPFTIAAWEPGPSSPDFFLPADIEAIARGRDAAGR